MRIAMPADHGPCITMASGLAAEIEGLRRVLRRGGPYLLGQWTAEINHVDSCDCDEDDEDVGENCMLNSDWSYAVLADGGSFAPRLIARLPRRPPPSCEDDVHAAALSTYQCCPGPRPDDGARLIAAERQRQIEVEGYAPADDCETNADGELLTAASCYLDDVRTMGGLSARGIPERWPWGATHWKPTLGLDEVTVEATVRQLAKAGALIAAEIDRLLVEMAVPTVPSFLAWCSFCHETTSVESSDARAKWVTAHQLTGPEHGLIVVSEFYDGGSVDLGLLREMPSDRGFQMTVEEWPEEER